LGKRKRPKKSRPHHQPSLSTEEQTRLNALLENFKKIDLTQMETHIPSPQLAQALLETLPTDDPDSLALILAIREAFKEKEIQKAVKKALFKIKQKGISVPDLGMQQETPFILKTTEKAEPSVYLGPIDGMGSRGVFILLPQLPKGVDLGLGVINDEKGMIQFVFGRYSKKRAREVKEVFFERLTHMVETSLAHVATALETAYAHQKESLGDEAKDYLQLRPWILDNVTLLDRSPIYDLIPLDSVSEKILTDSQIHKLLDHRLMESWIIEPSELKPMVDEISQVKESPILVSEAQQTNRVREIKEKAIGDFYPGEKRSVLKNRLEEMAYLFFKLNEEEYARICLTAAFSLEQKDSLLAVNPFLKAILARSLNFYQKMSGQTPESKPQTDDASRIIVP